MLRHLALLLSLPLTCGFVLPPRQELALVTKDPLERVSRPAFMKVPAKVASLMPWLLSAVTALTWSPPEPVAAATTVSSSVAVASAFESLCLGFGCGGFNGIDFNGAVAPDEPSISFEGFLKALDAKQVQKVELTGPNGDRAYASILTQADGESGAAVQRILIGAGYPIEASKAWSSPLWVVRILKDRGVPVTTAFDFSGVKTKANSPPFKP